eukprot:CAMPEP_0197398244 /NCGR_PEP_ID=MMETSP1165-20131217/12956_1 /TAXON_ID=284809 /ORGANISM="Chrysocystis fragilis, Strain CCMP3189" /LENGTH=397 /DNA_ID=CAMNT_0042924189 /DNA_START=139 /DNA_END=1329 /DNA_ORIENTATION=+
MRSRRACRYEKGRRVLSPPRPMSTRVSRRGAQGMLVYLGRSGVHAAQQAASAVLGESSRNPTASELRKFFGEDVRIVREEPLAAFGENSRMSRLVLSNEKTLVVKRRAESAAARGVAAIQRWYEREVYWYSELAEATPGVRCPKCATARYDYVTGSPTLALEDVSAKWTQLGESREELAAAVSVMASLHAAWRGAALPRRLPRTPIDVSLARQIEEYFVGSWTQVKVAPHYSFEDDVSSLVDGLASPGVYSSLARSLANSRNATVIHGDFRPANMVIHDETRQVCVYDWQFVSVGAGAYDLAYFLGLALDPAARRRLETDLINTYLDGLLGSHDAAARDAALPPVDLRAAVLLSLASFVMGAYTATDVHTHQTGIDRLARAALDWGFRTAALPRDAL